jgi:hypothetical protein
VAPELHIEAVGELFILEQRPLTYEKITGYFIVYPVI